MQQDERRRHARYGVRIEAGVTRALGGTATVVNISTGGVMILGEFYFAQWEVVLLELRFPDGTTIGVNACVCWMEAGLAGLKFEGVTTEQAAFLDLFISGLRG